MSLFKNFNGDFFDIPEDELNKYKITDEEARGKLKDSSLDGAEISTDDGDDVVGQSRMHQRTL